jgi:hypothetical protein
MPHLAGIIPVVTYFTVFTRRLAQCASQRGKNSMHNAFRNDMNVFTLKIM